MTRIAPFLAATLVVSLAAVGIADDKKKDDDKKPADIETIMNEGHKGKKAYLNVIKADAEAGNWGDAQKAAFKLRKFGDDLGKNMPPKGTDASWTILTKGYKEITEEIAKAVDDKDKTKTMKATATLSKSCSACHKQHKP